MARAGEVYTPSQYRLAYAAETTAGTANDTTMQLLNIQGMPTVTENAFRDASVRSGEGRTAKEIDATTITVGQVKTLSFSFLAGMPEIMDFIENCAGVEAEVAGNVQIDHNWTPPTVLIGDTDTDNTGLLTFALVPPYADHSRILAGCMVRTLTVNAAVGTEGGRFVCSVEADTKIEIGEEEAIPTGMVAYPAASDLSIYTLCSETSYNGIDVQLNSFELTLNNNLYIGGSCEDDYTYARGVPELEVSGNMTFLVDSNTYAVHQDALSVASAPISLTDGDNIAITIAKTVVTGDIPFNEVDGSTMFTVPFKAIASTSGQLADIKFGENT